MTLTAEQAPAQPIVDGVNHIAVSTTDLDRFVSFWADTCGLAFHPEADDAPFRHGMLLVGPAAAVHVFELREEITGPVAMNPVFRRGRIDHFGLNASDEHALRTVRDRLVDRGASDGAVTLFEAIPGFAATGLLSVHIEDPDGGHSEICCVRTGAAFTDEELTPFVPPTNIGTPSRELTGTGSR
jgi:catechol 2,3-dioxygenase-like lactoylglutathione lyase family enzyme